MPRSGSTVFTLVELMIVVAIMMVLAAIAIPSLHSMQLKAKAAEVPPNVDGIITAAVAYQTAHDFVLNEGALTPATPMGKTARPWTTGTNFDKVGWAPDGLVRGSYVMNAAVVDSGACDCLTGGTTEANSCGWHDVDADTLLSVYIASVGVGGAWDPQGGQCEIQ